MSACVFHSFSCVWLCNPIVYSPPGSSVCRIFQARILEWVVISSTRVSLQPRDWIQVSYGGCLSQMYFIHAFGNTDILPSCHGLWPLCGHLWSLPLRHHHESPLLCPASGLLLITAHTSSHSYTYFCWINSLSVTPVLSITSSVTSTLCWNCPASPYLSMISQ